MRSPSWLSILCYHGNILLIAVRKWNKIGTLGGPGKWEFEVGEDVRPMGMASAGFAESSSNVSVKVVDWGQFDIISHQVAIKNAYAMYMGE